MPDLSFSIENVAPVARAATPQLGFSVRVTNSQPDSVQSIALSVQVQIEPVRRRYTAEEQEHLRDLFGEPERWSQTLHPLLWSNVNLTVPGFTGSTLVEVPVPCTFDFNVAMTKYVYGLEAGELPTTLLFSGTIFYHGRVALQIAKVPWDREASYRVPVRAWKEMMDFYYPNHAWIALRRDVFERLCEYKSRYGIASWEQTLERMLGLTAEVKS
jgi:hypothetical protein